MSDLTRIPGRFSAGSTMSYLRELADYSASAGWSLTLYLSGGVTSPQTVTVDATAEGSGHRVTLTAEKSAALEGGSYRYRERVTDGTVVVDVGDGVVTVDPDPASADAALFLSIEERVLAAIEARIAGRFTKDQESLQVDNLAIARIPIDKLEKLRLHYQGLVDAQRNPGCFGPRTQVTFSESRCG